MAGNCCIWLYMAVNSWKGLEKAVDDDNDDGDGDDGGNDEQSNRMALSQF